MPIDHAEIQSDVAEALGVDATGLFTDPVVRERAREVLLLVQCRSLPEYADYSPDISLWTEQSYTGGQGPDFGWCVEYRAHRKMDRVYGLGETLGEATAVALGAAARAMKGVIGS